MNFKLVDEANINLFKRLLELINLRKNGVASDSMKEAGLNYKVNFGVSLVDLRNLAKSYKYNNILASLLWDKGWRETYILATLIADPKTLNTLELNRWLDEIPNSEVAEQLGNNILAQIDNGELLKILVQSPDNLKRFTAFKAFSRMFLLKQFAHKTLFVELVNNDLLIPSEKRMLMAGSLGQAIAFLIRFDNNLINHFTEKILYFNTVSEDFKFTLRNLNTEIDCINEQENSA